MKLKHYIVLAITLFAFNNIHAQSWNTVKYEYYVGLGATNFMGDVSAPTDANKLIWVNFFNTIGPYGDFGLRYKWKEREHINLNISLGQIYAKDPVGDPNYWDFNREANTFFTEVSGRYEFLILKEKPRRTVYRILGESPLKNFNLPTYVFAGLGAMVNVGKFTQIPPNNASSIISEPIFNFAPIIPVGIGFKTRLSDVSYLNIEATIRIALSDGIDYANGDVGGGGSWFDQYQTITFNYVHKLKANANGWPKFRRR